MFTETDDDPRHTLTASGSLILKDVGFGDTAIYQCQASNKHGTIITNTHVYVIGEYFLCIGHLFDSVLCVCVTHLSFVSCFRAASSDPY